MIIAIEYKNGRMKEFDTSAFTTTNAMSAGDRTARNVMTELDLRLDLVDKVGLRLDFYWYDATPQGDRIRPPGFDGKPRLPYGCIEAPRYIRASMLAGRHQTDFPYHRAASERNGRCPLATGVG